MSVVEVQDGEAVLEGHDVVWLVHIGYLFMLSDLVTIRCYLLAPVTLQIGLHKVNLDPW